MAPYPLKQPEDFDGLVIHCSDPRFQEAFQRFVTEELGMQCPAKIIIPGGIHDLMLPARIKAARHIKQWIEFLTKELNLHRIVIINHEGCRWYEHWNTLVATPIGHDITHHLLEVRKILAIHRLNVNIETYLAKIEEGEVVFQKVTG